MNFEAMRNIPEDTANKEQLDAWEENTQKATEAALALANTYSEQGRNIPAKLGRAASAATELQKKIKSGNRSQVTIADSFRYNNELLAIVSELTDQEDVNTEDVSSEDITASELESEKIDDTIEHSDETNSELPESESEIVLDTISLIEESDVVPLTQSVNQLLEEDTLSATDKEQLEALQLAYAEKWWAVRNYKKKVAAGESADGFEGAIAAYQEKKHTLQTRIVEHQTQIEQQKETVLTEQEKSTEHTANEIPADRPSVDVAEPATNNFFPDTVPTESFPDSHSNIITEIPSEDTPFFAPDVVPTESLPENVELAKPEETTSLQSEEGEKITVFGMDIPSTGSEAIFGARSFREALKIQRFDFQERPEQLATIDQMVEILTPVLDSGITAEQYTQLVQLASELQKTQDTPEGIDAGIGDSLELPKNTEHPDLTTTPEQAPNSSYSIDSSENVRSIESVIGSQKILKAIDARESKGRGLFSRLLDNSESPSTVFGQLPYDQFRGIVRLKRRDFISLMRNEYHGKKVKYEVLRTWASDVSQIDSFVADKFPNQTPSTEEVLRAYTAERVLSGT